MRTVRVRGTVTLIDPILEYFVLQDETAGMRVRPVAALNANMLGHKVEVDGQSAPENEADVMTGAKVEDLGAGVHPDAQPFSLKPGGVARLDGQLVNVTGIPLDARADALGRLSIMIRVSESGHEAAARLTVIKDSRGKETDIVDAEVQFKAVLSATTDLNGRISGFGLISYNLDSLQVLQAPLNTEALLLTSVDALIHATTPLSHRVKLRGRIQRDGAAGELELADQSGRIRLLNSDEVIASPGNGIQNIAGFVSMIDGQMVVEYARSLN